MSTQNVTAAQSSYSFIKEVAEDKNMQETKGWVPLVIQIFSYLDNKTLKSLKSVCKNFYKIMKLDQIWAVQLKNYESEVKNLDMQRNEFFQKILKMENEVNEAEAELTKRKQDMGKLEFFASWVSSFDKIISLSSFSSIDKLKTSYKEYGDLKESCDLLKKQHETDGSIESQLQITINHEYAFLNKIKMTKGLLGKRYASLPILKLRGKKGRIEFVKPKWMTAPIMKGQDAYERSFIAIRAKNKKTGKIHAQTFYPLSFQSSDWKTSYSDSPIVSFSDDFLVDGIMNHDWINKAGYKALKDLIEKGENEEYILV